jgi:putative tryptophan/tyrosine transport system substrate-binding protein
VIRRREFIAGLGGAAAWPLIARAQQPASVGRRRKMHRLAVIDLSAPIAHMVETSPDLFFREFFRELRRLGYVEGENLIVHCFSSEGHAQRNPEVVMAAIRSAPDVIFAISSRMVKLLKDATTVIPIVGYTADPVSFGIVGSLARPGGNVTGISTEAGVEVDGKRLDLFKKIMPTASRLAVLAPVAVWESPYGATIRMLSETLGFIPVGRPLGDTIDEAEYMPSGARFPIASFTRFSDTPSTSGVTVGRPSRPTSPSIPAGRCRESSSC